MDAAINNYSRVGKAAAALPAGKSVFIKNKMKFAATVFSLRIFTSVKSRKREKEKC